MKKIWEKPKLVVLYRAKVEESVLAACKGSGSVQTGPIKKKCRARTGPGYCSVNAVS